MHLDMCFLLAEVQHRTKESKGKWVFLPLYSQGKDPQPSCPLLLYLTLG